MGNSHCLCMAQRTSMTKEERLILIRTRMQALDLEFGELPVTKKDIQEEAKELDAFREEVRDKETASEVLTSDEK